jgi:lysophospholipase L1-like esterase
MCKWIIAACLTGFLAGCGSGNSVQVQPTPARSNVVAFMVDSITARWAPTMPAIADAVELNLGIPDQTSADMLARFQAQVIDASPQIDVVVILAGTNDFYYDGIANSNTDNVKAMAAMAKAVGIRVIIGSMFPAHYPDSYPPGTTPTLAQITAWNDSLITIAADNGYLYADYFDEFLLPDGTQDFALYSDYGVHPNAAGYEKMWSTLLPLIQEELR